MDKKPNDGHILKWVQDSYQSTVNIVTVKESVASVLRPAHLVVPRGLRKKGRYTVPDISRTCCHRCKKTDRLSEGKG